MNELPISENDGEKNNMTSTYGSPMKRLAVIAFISVMILTLVAPAIQATCIPQTNGTGSENDNSRVPTGSHVSTIAVQRAPPREEKVLVLRAKLADKSFQVNINSLRSLFVNSTKQYYQEVSYNQVFMNTTFISDNYTMSGTEAYYGTGSGEGSTGSHIIDLVTETLTAAEGQVNASGGYRIFRHIIIVHSGTDQASSHVATDIGSEYIFKEGAELFTIHGLKIMNACIVSEDDPLGVVVHELGHSQGLPDLYNYLTESTGDTFVGQWDLMATGSWSPNGQGSSPSHLTTWCKIKLGWIGPTQIVNISQSSIASGHDVNITLDPQEIQGPTLVIRIQLDNGTYYLVEDRLKTGYDTSLPASGVLVLFCDDSKASGSGPVQVMSAHPPDLGGTAAFNVGYFMQSFYGERDRFTNIGIRVVYKWSDGTFQVFVGSYDAAYNAPTNYQETINIPLVIIMGGVVVLGVIAVLVYLSKGRRKATKTKYEDVPVIKLS
jgi:M6 family metalloprotease-like protein